jgi:predicted peptidase
MKMPYLLYLPPDYVSDKSPKPVLIFLHGVGERGTDLQGVYGWGPDGQILRVPGFKERYPFIGIAPQCAEPTRWENPEAYKTVVAIIKEVLATYNADKDRVYLTGLSMGGRGTWETALEAPELFAAIAPISSIAVRPEEAAQKLKKVNLWIICGANDGGYTVGSKQMNEVMTKAGELEVKFTMHPNRGHDVWTDYYPTEKLYTWFLTCKRGQKPVAKP